MRKLANEELNRLSVEEYKEVPKQPVVVVLDNVRSLYNVGSVFRTCDAFRVEGLYLCGITARPPHREIRKTALGATESVRWQYFEDTGQAIASLKKEGYTILAVEQATHSVMLDEYTPPKDARLAVIFGNEVEGVGEAYVKQADACIEIPQLGTKHSFNISVSVGIVLWDLFIKMKE